MQRINTFVIPIIRDDFIERCLETLYKYTPPNFYVFVIDQTPRGLPCKYKTDPRIHMLIRPYRNLGFSKAVNTGFALCQTPYMTCLNDDVEFMNSQWWQGIEDTFAVDEKIVAVNPNSPKEGAWGYGLTEYNKDTWTPREGFVRDEDGKSVIPVINGKPFTYKEEFTNEEYQSLLTDHPVWDKNSLCDGLACWATTFKRSALKEMGWFDEKFYPGGGEDYAKMCDIYSCAWPNDREDCDPKFHFRAVGTTKSWVWHHWGKSKDDVSGKDPENKLFESRSRWNDLEEIYGEKFDVWGHYTDDKGVRKPLRRKTPIHTDDL